MPKALAVDGSTMWGIVRRLLSLKTLFALLGAYVVLSASALAVLDLRGVALLVAFVTLAFSVVAIGVVGAYVTWLRKETASMNSPPPEYEHDFEEFADADGADGGDQ